MSTADRCKETTTTTGTGNITLLGAVSQFQAFSDVFTPPATVSYAIVGQSGTEWEVGVGTLSATSTLERTTVQSSSNGNAAVNFSAGTKDVFATITAQDMADIMTALAGKAATSHTHAISDTTGLQTALDGKAASSHTHAISDTTGLQTALDGKASSSHTHASGDITGLAASATTDTTNATNISSGTVADARLSSNVALENVANTFTAAQTVSVNGALSTPAVSITGTIITGGNGTTTTPQLLIEPTGTTSNSWSTSGTLLGLNAPSGFSGNVVDVKTNNTTRVSITSAGVLSCAAGVTVSSGNILNKGGSYYLGSSDDVIIGREAAAIVQLGLDAASPTTQTFKGADARAGTDTNTAGGTLNIAAGRGTGTAAGGELRLQTSAPTTSGTGAGTLTTRVAISGTTITASLPVVLPGYTVAQLNALTGLTEGMTAYCTDATAPTYLGTLTGGGAVKCPVFYNGSAWVSH